MIPETDQETRCEDGQAAGLDEPIIDTPRNINASIWCLRWVVLLQSLGVAARYVFSVNESESDVYGLLYFDHQWPEAVAQRLDDWGSLGCLIAGAAVFACGVCEALIDRHQDVRTYRRSVSLAERLGALVVAFWFSILALCHTLRGEIYSEATFGEVAVRIAAPVVLVLLQGQSPPITSAKCLAIVATSATFLVHGYKALVAHGPFTDLILLTDARIFGFDWQQSTVEIMLFWIGIVDIVVAIGLIIARWPMVAAYMAFWGSLTSLSRMTALGWDAFPESLIRAANWGLPLAIVLIKTKK